MKNLIENIDFEALKKQKSFLLSLKTNDEVDGLLALIDSIQENIFYF